VNGALEPFTWDLVAGPPLLLQDGNTEYIYGPQGSAIEQISPSGTATYLHQDQLGSTRLITDGSGNVAATYTYNAFGSTTSHTGSASTSLQFAGEFNDPETGFYYLRTRYYDPTTGQFASVDAVAPSTREPYAYVNDSPLNGTDPSGLFGPTCAELLGQITALAKQAWGKAQGAARDEANCNSKGAKGHWKSFNQLMSSVDNLVQKYKAKGCPALPGWIEDLLTCYYEGKNCPGPDDTEPWLFSSLPWQPIQPPSTNPVWPPKWIQPTPTWPPKLPWPPKPNPIPIPIFFVGFTF
jgi:RHS repeat-associated protein